MSSKPTIDINAKREEIAKFIKENKVPIKVTEVVDGKKKKRGVKALREDLTRLGYGTKGEFKERRGGKPTTLKGMRKAQERKEETGIQIQGFSGETKPPAPQVSGQEVELMGAISGKLSAEQEVIYKNLPPADEMRGFLFTRLPRENFIGIPLRELKLLYMRKKAEENEELFAPQYKDLPPLPEIKSYLREQLPSVNIDTLTLVGIKELYIKTKTKVDEALRIKAEEEAERQYQQAIADKEAKEKAEDTDTDTDEDEELPPETEEMKEARLKGFARSPYGVLYTHEGVTYQQIGDKLYDRTGQYIGKKGKHYWMDFEYAPGGEELHEKNQELGERKPRRWKKPIITEEPEPEPEEEITEEEVDTLLDLVGDTSKFYRVRLQAWEDLRDAGINISKPIREPATPINPRPETLDTDDDTEDEGDLLEYDEPEREEIVFEGVKYYVDEDDIINRPPRFRIPDYAGLSNMIRNGAAVFNKDGLQVGKWDTSDRNFDDIIFFSDELKELHENGGYQPAVAGDDSDL